MRQIEINRKWCKKCRICSTFCPKNVLEADEDGAPVVAEVLEAEKKDRKIYVFKYKAKKNEKKKIGHRQIFTKIQIKSINA